MRQKEQKQIRPFSPMLGTGRLSVQLPSIDQNHTSSTQIQSMKKEGPYHDGKSYKGT